MYKRKKARKLHREKDQRKALLKSLARSFVLKERIKTTQVKAKVARSLVEKYITLAKKENLSSERQLLKIFPKNLVKKLIKDIAPRYKERKGGYTRIINLGERKSDKTKMVILELLKETSYAKKDRA